MRPMRDRTGGIEGMPLQLMILVIVAGLTLAVVLGWTLSIQGPAVIKSVTTDPAVIDLGPVPEDRTAMRTVVLRVTAYDGKDQPIRDIVVSLRGAVVRSYVSQDAADGSVDGTATFGGVQVTLPPGVSVGEVAITVQKSGYPSKAWSLPVVRGG